MATVCRVRKGTNLLEMDGKTFTEILAHEIGHHLESPLSKFFSDDERKTLQKLYNQAVDNHVEKIKAMQAKGKAPKGEIKLPPELEDSGEWWAYMIQRHEHIRTFGRAAVDSNNPGLKRLFLKLVHLGKVSRYEKVLAKDRAAKDMMSLYETLKRQPTKIVGDGR